MILRIVCILISVASVIAVSILSNNNFSPDTQTLIMSNGDDIEPFGDLYLCDDFIYRVGKSPLNPDDAWERNRTRFGSCDVVHDGETSNSHRWGSAERLPMRWEPVLKEYPINYPLNSDNHTLAAVKQAPKVSP